VRPDLKTPEVCLAAIQQNDYLKFISNVGLQHFHGYFKSIPLEKQTPELCLAAVQRYGPKAIWEWEGSDMW
jgi:hypothetical protein